MAVGSGQRNGSRVDDEYILSLFLFLYHIPGLRNVKYDGARLKGVGIDDAAGGGGAESNPSLGQGVF